MSVSPKLYMAKNVNIEGRIFEMPIAKMLYM